MAYRKRARRRKSYRRVSSNRASNRASSRHTVRIELAAPAQSGFPARGVIPSVDAATGAVTGFVKTQPNRGGRF